MSQVDNVLKAFAIFKQAVSDNKDYLSDLDTPIGDGDHGNNMYRGVIAMAEMFEGQTFQQAADIFKTAAMALMSKVGGASGPLYGTALLEMSKQLKVDATDYVGALKAAAGGIKKRGHAEAGDKTMLDVWLPAGEALASGELTVDAIDQWVQATEAMQARKGRASYVGERSVGHIDPGSMSTGYLLKAFLEAGVFND
ncbi:dihydroxyacetone kinase subunit DhaL [Hutsoniella sourekii]|uniref:dihydroxyacetone kinase subunit DhaL n=1 Tax=Hutsoniella sourekii TaxID=87650 RepID=UPI0004873503|nr:dihydroxyacetone kinase subunit DhaL [Hutsoniella sourekii]